MINIKIKAKLLRSSFAFLFFFIKASGRNTGNFTFAFSRALYIRKCCFTQNFKVKLLNALVREVKIDTSTDR